MRRVRPRRALDPSDHGARVFYAETMGYAWARDGDHVVPHDGGARAEIITCREHDVADRAAACRGTTPKTLVTIALQRPRRDTTPTAWPHTGCERGRQRGGPPLRRRDGLVRKGAQIRLTSSIVGTLGDDAACVTH